MKIKIETKFECEEFQVPLNTKAMDLSKAVTYDKYITIPYQDPELLQDENTQQIVTHIANQTDWAFPDYDATKLNLVFEVNEDFEINGLSEIVSSSLQVIAQPPVYTKQEKEDILKRETDDEMYITWQEIFYYAEDFYKNEDKHFDNSYEEVEIELDEGEMKVVQAGLYNEMATC